MKYTEDEKKAQEIAQQALQRIKSAGLAPTPENFELWYCYYSNINQDVVREIDNLDSEDSEQYAIIYDKYLSTDKNEEAVKRAGDTIQEALEEMAGVLASVKNATSEYGDNLGDVTTKIRKAENIEELQEVVGELVEDTRKMAEHNKDLESQIENSSIQVDELRRDLDDVRKEAMTDGLTGLCNRKKFDNAIRENIIEAMETEQPLSLLMLDIDHFKQFNDTYGHQVGDQVLRLVSKTLTDGIKGRDTAARYGGEEFSIILPETELKGGLIVAENLRIAVENKEIVNRTTGENLGQITLSVGVAEFIRGEQITELIDRADAALYTAKDNGRNQVAAAAPPEKAPTGGTDVANEAAS